MLGEGHGGCARLLCVYGISHDAKIFSRWKAQLPGVELLALELPGRGARRHFTKQVVRLRHRARGAESGQRARRIEGGSEAARFRNP